MRQGSEKLNKLSSEILALALRIVTAALLIFILVRGVSFAYDFGYSAFHEESVEEEPGRDIRVTIPEDMDAFDAAPYLLRKGLLKSVWPFRIQAVFFGLKVNPGTYTLNTSETPKEILEILDTGASGDSGDSGEDGAESASGTQAEDGAEDVSDAGGGS